MGSSSSLEVLLALRRQAWELEPPTAWVPLRAARTATLGTWRYGRTVPDVPRDEQWRQQWRLRVQFRSSSDSYYRYRLYDPRRRADAPAFLEVPEIRALRSWLYDKLLVQPEALADKRRFVTRAVAAGLPTPPVLATLSGGQILDASSRLPKGDLFTKEAQSMCGLGASYWVWQTDGSYVSSTGERVPQGRFLEHLAARSAGAPLLVQPRLRNHPEMARWALEGLCTVRVMTTRAPGGPPMLLRAGVRMPTGRAPVDNFTQGGVASPVDLTTGVLGPAVRKPPELAGESLDSHPTTGARIAGAVLPQYSEVFALALRAHRAFAEFPSVGWDVAITRDGLMLMEGNYDWGIVFAQQLFGSSLATTTFAEHFWAHASATRPANAPRTNVA